MHGIIQEANGVTFYYKCYNGSRPKSQKNPQWLLKFACKDLVVAGGLWEDIYVSGKI